MSGPAQQAIGVDDVLITAELDRRPSRAPDFQAESEALRDLAEVMANRPDQILQRLVETAKAQMDADVRRARDELRREVADLATAVAEKLVRRSLRDDDHRRIVAEAITKVGN